MWSSTGQHKGNEARVQVPGGKELMLQLSFIHYNF